jgi:hypothetical protein
MQLPWWPTVSGKTVVPAVTFAGGAGAPTLLCHTNDLVFARRPPAAVP